MKHFTLLELGSDTESPMIGTIDNIPNNKQGINSFKDRFSIAIKEHFDIVDFSSEPIPDLFVGSPYEDIVIEMDGVNYIIRVLETWIY